MSYTIEEIKEGIKLHLIDTKKFKTNLISVVISMPLDRKNVTFNTMIPAVLKRGTKNLKSQDEISKKLEEMYGAEFDCGIEKIGDNHILKFYIETLNDNFLPEKNMGISKESLDLLFDIILNPCLEDGLFKEEYVESEKNNIKLLIESKIDNKAAYALNRCVEEMYKDEPYGIYKFGYVEDLEGINKENLYARYKEIINTAKIDIFFSGNIDKNEIIQYVKENENIKKLDNRKANIIINTNKEIEEKEVKTIEDKMDVTQGKLVIGLDVKSSNPDDKFKIAMYNVILGESATSKLFQNVREKASLAYTAGSNYVRQKSNIFIRCGIEIENYEKAVDIIKKQLEDMKNGDFTDEDLENAKKYMISGINSVKDEQDSEITYYIGQEMSDKFTSFEEYINEVQKVTMEDVKNVANSIAINTVYFLRN